MHFFLDWKCGFGENVACIPDTTQITRHCGRASVNVVGDRIVPGTLGDRKENMHDTCKKHNGLHVYLVPTAYGTLWRKRRMPAMPPTHFLAGVCSRHPKKKCKIPFGDRNYPCVLSLHKLSCEVRQ